MYKNILVPLDGSQRAEKILPYVEELAQQTGAMLNLLQVVEPEMPLAGIEAAHAETAITTFRFRTEEAQNYLRGLRGKFGKRGLDVQAQVAFGPVVETILRIAEQIDADLIALASHGRSGLSRVFYGSVAAGVLNRTDRALLVVRADQE